MITDYIRRLIEFPEALQVLNFARGRVSLVAVRAYEGGLLVGKPIKQMREFLPADIDARIAAIFRRDQPVFPAGDTVIEAGDEVFLLAAAEHIRPVMRQLRRMVTPVQRIMIAGGGNIGLRVAKSLEKRYEIKIIEGRKERAELLAGELDNALVLLGDATDEELLEQENIGEMDLFLAVTNDDEDNIMSGSLAKRLGCKRVLALINRRAYAEMIEGGPIDIGISPAQVSIGTLAGARPAGRCGRGALAAARCRRSAGNRRPRRCQDLQGDRPADRPDRLAARGDDRRPGAQFRQGGGCRPDR